MPYNGSGVYAPPAADYPAVANTLIESTKRNNIDADIATALSTCVLKDGTQTITANIPMSGFKLTGLAAGSANGHSLRYEQVNGLVTTAGDLLYATAAGTLARLAIGTANQRLTVNSGATAPQWSAGPVGDSTTRTAGDVTTTSTSLVDLTGASVTITTGANACLVGFAGSFGNNTDGAVIWMNVDIDGTLQCGSSGIQMRNAVNGARDNASFTIRSATLTAASHTFKAQWRVDSGTGTIMASASVAAHFWAQEQR